MTHQTNPTHLTDLAALRRSGALASDTEALDLLCALSPPHRGRRAMAEAELAEGGYRLQWCRVALDRTGRPLAAHAWWARPGTDTPHLVDLFGATDLDAAVELLVGARADLDLDVAECWLSVPGDGDTAVEQANPVEVPVLRVTGFRRIVDRVRLEWLPRDGVPEPEPPGRLEFRPAGSFSRPELLEIFAAVGDGSLDHHMRAGRTRDGVAAEAGHRLEHTAAMSGPPHWFAIGVDASGTPVGYVRAAHVTGGHPVLAEIGVVRAMRGRRFVDDLLAHGTRLLAEAGAARITSDTDLANTPMRAAFGRAGYREFARRYDFRWQRTG
ncbi:MAG TPA: GNAT family N-acetyltransferase [Mycobacteriales bacterium]|nr:GNAT family N-acetyltransferase [Mycobacteriales bacterium]